jgi:hypothetical protein
VAEVSLRKSEAAMQDPSQGVHRELVSHAITFIGRGHSLIHGIVAPACPSPIYISFRSPTPRSLQ